MGIKYLFSKLCLKIQVPSIKNSIIDKSAKIASKATFYSSNIGRYSYVGVGSYVIKTQIGAFCSIANDCSIGLGRHPSHYVSTSPVFYSDSNIFGVSFGKTEFNEYETTIIENDVWIGERALIKDGVHIGNGAIIGAGTIVTHDVPPYAIVVGNPGRIIRYRFDDDTIERLLHIKWWELNDQQLTECSALFNDTLKLLDYIEEKLK